ncbi:MAG: nucleoside triphosphate pyrophosphohydrolase [Bacteroidota bacterium]
MKNNYYLSPSDDPKRSEKLAAFDRLLTIMDELRVQCPWDKKQTLDSLRYLTLEEVYELSDSIISKDYPELEKELGDIMLHIVFYAKIGAEQKLFDIGSILTAISDKLVHRHPHIYGDAAKQDGLVKVVDENDVKDNWEKIKLKEKGKKSVLGGVPKSLPALVKALRIQEKAKGVGFEWERREQVWDKVEEEIKEFVDEVNNKEVLSEKHERLEDEFGDVLFSLINYARFIDINPENALERTNRKFIKRFKYIEEEAVKNGNNITEMTLEEMDKLWNEAKSIT